MRDFIIYFSGHGEVKDATLLSLEALRRMRDYSYEVRIISGDALIGRSRSRAATDYLKRDDSPYMIFIDTDIVFTPEDIDKLYTAMAQGLDVVAGAYAVANGEYLAISGTTPVSFDGRISEIEYVSTGFMAISRKILERVRDELQMPLLHKGEWCECYPFFESGSLPEKQIYISEDWDFCAKVRKIGGHVFIHTGALVGHIKPHTLDPRDALQKMVEREKGNPKKEERDELLKDIAEFYQVSQDEADVKVRSGCAAAIKESTANKDFYHTSQNLPFDLADFNSNPEYEGTRLSALKDVKDLKVLDFGCGIGTAAFWLARKRNTVLAYDISEQNLAFARFRNEKYGFSKVTFTDTLPDELDVDLIIAIDVFEHIADIEGTLRDLRGRVKKGTRLYFFSPWWHKHPLHITGKDKTMQALKDTGWILWNDNWAVAA